LGGNNRGMIEQGKILAAGIWMLISLAFIVPSLIVLSGVIFYPDNFTDPLKDLMMFVAVFAGFALLGTIPLGGYIYGMLSSVYAAAKSYPIRFNRQRREVCYVDGKTHR
ncbi:hypothetical protein NPS47_25510, partial [Pseudomonas putida]|nr:hypothetical protein [Pseudomonas putida]